MLKQLLHQAREWFQRARKWKLAGDDALYRVRYTSVPVWKPWRDF